MKALYRKKSEELNLQTTQSISKSNENINPYLIQKYKMNALGTGDKFSPNLNITIDIVLPLG